MTTTLTRLPLSAPANLRDLGGTRIAGGVMSTGLAIRSDDLSIIAAADAGALLERGLRAVIDLRSPEEVAATGRGVLASHPVNYHHLPLMSSMAQGLSGTKDGALDHEQMGEMYAAMVDRAAPAIATALTVIAMTPGATAFHCAGGRDRTGVVAAMLLLALGASEDDIVADYSLTQQNMAAVMNRTAPVMEALLGDLGFDLAKMTRKLQGGEPMAISMRLLLKRLRERHGDPLTPVRTAGLSGDTISRLRNRALATS